MMLNSLVVLLAAAAAVVNAQTPCSSLSLTVANEIAALRDIYSSTVGFSWLVNLQWPPTTQPVPTFNPCCWVGVTCVNYFGVGVRVAELNLAHNNLKGSLPNSIGNLPFLNKL